MSTRELNAQLKELQDKGIPVYSISRLDAINNCLYEAFQTYILGDRGQGNIYGYAGSKIHDVLEKIVNNEAQPEDLLPAMLEELDDMATLGIDFPVDSNGNETFKNNWVADMTHFCKTYEKPEGDFDTEEFFLYKTTKGHYLQGYIDLKQKFEDGSISIFDYKTSSMYTGEAIKEHGRQLLVYAMAKMQEGYKVNKIAWNMLKYAEISFKGYKTAKSKEKTYISKVIERRKIGTELAKYVESDLKEAGYDDFDIDVILSFFRNHNDISQLPEDIRSNYRMRPAIISYELSEENIAECEDYINRTIEMWESMSGEEKDYPPMKFTRMQKNGKEVLNVFYCVSLCNHKNCAYVKDFLDQWNQSEAEEEDIFS